jgi:hypothetical protein
VIDDGGGCEGKRVSAICREERNVKTQEKDEPASDHPLHTRVNLDIDSFDCQLSKYPPCGLFANGTSIAYEKRWMRTSTGRVAARTCIASLSPKDEGEEEGWSMSIVLVALGAEKVRRAGEGGEGEEDVEEIGEKEGVERVGMDWTCARLHTEGCKRLLGEFDSFQGAFEDSEEEGRKEESSNAPCRGRSRLGNLLLLLALSESIATVDEDEGRRGERLRRADEG